MSARYNELIISTPEGVEFVRRLASPVTRFIALAVDVMIVSSIMTLLSLITIFMQWVSVDLAQAFTILLYFVLSIGYFVFLEAAWRGQTVGKRMMRLRVMDANGLKLQASQVLLRNLLRFVDSLPFLYFVGGSCALLSKRSQRLGDLAAGTIVVREPELQAPSLSDLGEKSYNSFRDHPRLEALLRQRVPPEASELGMQALRRREELEPTERARLYRRLADYFRGEVKFPEAITEALSDEQYLRNCVDTIYRAAK